ncbi:RING-H2 finger protein ATL16-like [Oryza brachyantha]|uniref:RING-H2 finger protein ATL16-like n=1 Tax=Oryza brachyantha TaxID=4533 RepID=UPI001ADBBEF0|nr:RING-H2 finger protein ATL16-like [Oryza brachyantha]
MDAPPAFASSSPSPSSSNASVPMVVITVVGILAAFALLASYYAFVTKCQACRGLWSSGTPWRGHGGARRRSAAREAASVIRTVATEERGLGMPFIRMLPVVKFTAAACGGGARISVSECAVCLSEFVERERVRLLPNCSHAFHIDCIDTWLQGNARCPFCRSDVTLPFPPPVSTSARTAPCTHPVSCSDGDAAADSARHRRRSDELINSIVIEVRGEHESWAVSHGGAPATRTNKQESVGDEAIDTRKKCEEFAVQPMRRSLSMDSSCHKQLYVSVQEFLTQRQV